MENIEIQNQRNYAVVEAENSIAEISVSSADNIIIALPGAQGIQGEVGLQGPQGLQGLQGIQGTQGSQGIQGENGPQGPQGIAGENGLNGTDGHDGADGVGVPPGGKQNLFLAKLSGNDYDTIWRKPHWINEVVVDLFGGADFDNIEDAINFVNSQYRDESNRWVITLMPGIYKPKKFTVPTYTAIVGYGYQSIFNNFQVKIDFSNTPPSGTCIYLSERSDLCNLEITFSDLINISSPKLTADLNLIYFKPSGSSNETPASITNCNLNISCYVGASYAARVVSYETKSLCRLIINNCIINCFDYGRLISQASNLSCGVFLGKNARIRIHNTTIINNNSGVYLSNNNTDYSIKHLFCSDVKFYCYYDDYNTSNLYDLNINSGNCNLHNVIYQKSFGNNITHLDRVVASNNHSTYTPASQSVTNLTLKQVLSQTAPTLEIKNSAGLTIASINAGGIAEFSGYKASGSNGITQIVALGTGQSLQFKAGLLVAVI
jgi:hypothetical protein